MTTPRPLLRLRKLCLDKDCDWSELAGLLRNAYRLIAPKRLLETLDHA